ncbi:MAG: hypothetical protein AB7I27_11810 [Bacteriovoracaceae bacterium]
MIRVVSFLLILSLVPTIYAQNDPVGLIFHGTLGLLFSASQGATDPKIPSDQVAGKCEYEGSNCNGAKVVLVDKDIFFQEKTLVAQGEFKYINLKKNHEYILEISWPAHKLKETRKVKSGNFYNLKFVEKKY